MKLSDYSIGNIVCFIVRILIIMGLVFEIKLLAIIPAALCGILLVVLILTNIGTLSKESHIVSIVIMLCVILASLYGNTIARYIAALLPLSDIIAIMYSQWKGKYYGDVMEDLERGDF